MRDIMKSRFFNGSLAPMVGLTIGLGLNPCSLHAATKTWSSAASGNWSDGNKWAPAGAPSSGDDVFITIDGATNYTVTLDVNVTNVSLMLGATSGTIMQTLSASSRTLILNSGSVVNANGVLALNNSTVAGAGTL